MYSCENCNCVYKRYIQYCGHLSYCTRKFDKIVCEEKIILEQNLDNVTIENENIYNDYYSSNESENELDYNVFQNDNHKNKYINFQKSLIDNSIIDRIKTGRIKLLDGSYSKDTTVNDYMEISNYGLYL